MRTLIFLAVPVVMASCGQPMDPAEHGSISEDVSERGKPVSDTTGPHATASVVFYNVENLFDTRDDPGPGDDDFTPAGKLNWTQERYAHKLHQLAQAISMAGEELPVLIGLCEVENRKVVEDLANTPPLDGGNYVVIHQDSPDERGIDVALLVDRKRVIVGETVWLNVDLGSDRTRDVLHATVDLKGEGPVEVFVNHWPSRREGERESAPKRMEAAKTVRGEVDRLLAMNANARIIIMGDLNDEPLDASLKNGLKTQDNPHQSEFHGLWDLIAWDDTPPRGTICFKGEWQYFDHIIFTSALYGTVGKEVKAARAPNPIRDPRLIFHHPKYGDQPNRTFSGTKYHKDGYSDHLPVVLRLE